MLQFVDLARRAVLALERMATAAEARNRILADPEWALEAMRADRTAAAEYQEVGSGR